MSMGTFKLQNTLAYYVVKLPSNLQRNHFLQEDFLLKDKNHLNGYKQGK